MDIQSSGHLHRLAKVDLSFKLGYQELRLEYFPFLVAHILQFIILTIFLSIDIILLPHHQHILIAIGVSILINALLFIVKKCLDYQLFTRKTLGDVLELARITNHLTDQPLSQDYAQRDSSVWAWQPITSNRWLFYRDNTSIRGRDNRTIDLYVRYANQQIQKEYFRQHEGLECGFHVLHAVGLASAVLTIVMMATAEQLHPIQHVVLTLYIIVEAFIDLKLLFFILVGVGIVAASPFIGIWYLITTCCCSQGQAQPVELDLASNNATVQQVVAAGGNCAICLMAIRAGGEVYRLQCSQKHVFHSFCLKRWMKVKPNCPICRADLPLRLVQGSQQPVIVREQ